MDRYDHEKKIALMEDEWGMIYGIRGTSAKKVLGEIITADKKNASNDFGKPEEVTIKPFSGAQLRKGLLHVNLPAKSVVMLELD